MEGKKITVDISVKAVFVVVLSVVLLWLFYFLRDILVLFFIAFIFATALEPAVDFGQKLKIPRWMSILAIYILAIVGVFGLVKLIIPPITEQTKHLLDNRQIIIDRFNHYFNIVPPQIHDTLNKFASSLSDRLSKYSTSSAAVSSVFGVFSGLLGVVTVLVVTFYLLLEKNSMEGFVASYWPISSREKAVKVFKKIVEKVSLWARGQLVLSGSVGALTLVGLLVLRIDYALTLALIAGVTELLPVVGPYIGAFPALIIAFTMSPVTALWVLILYIGIQQFEAHVLVPQVMKRAVGISPVGIIFAILVGAKLLGILGVVIAVPVAAAVGVLIEETNRKGEK